jgi:uncharacterized protein YkwD
MPFFLVILLGWDTKDYASYTHEAFLSSKEANQIIDTDNFDAALMNAAIFYATNEYRKKNRKTLFQFNTVLEQSATLHSTSMLKHNFFDHINKHNRALRTPILRIQKAGGADFTSVSENLIYSNVYVLGKKGEYFEKGNRLVDKSGKPLKTYTYAGLARNMVLNWHKSKGHRENLKGDYAFLGCGVSEIKTLKNGLKVVYATQNFGSK